MLVVPIASITAFAKMSDTSIAGTKSAPAVPQDMDLLDGLPSNTSVSG